MTEEEYIMATNLAKIRSAVFILADVMCGDEYGVNEPRFRRATAFLSDAQDDLYEILRRDRDESNAN